MDRLTEIIQRQRELQTEYGYDYAKMDLGMRVRTIQDMYVAAQQELGEALNETSWKPWTTGSPYINEAMTGEIVDTLQFILNMLFAQYPDLSAENLAELLRYKHEKKVKINRDRLANDYDGVSTKCPSCKRALDEVVTHEIYIAEIGKYGIVCPCGTTAYVSPNPA